MTDYAAMGLAGRSGFDVVPVSLTQSDVPPPGKRGPKTAAQRVAAWIMLKECQAKAARGPKKVKMSDDEARIVKNERNRLHMQAKRKATK